MSDRGCRRGLRCAARTPAVDPAGVRTGWVPALLSHPSDGFCPPCRGRLRGALTELPDLMGRLDGMHIPTLAVRLRHVLTSGGDPHPAVPLNLLADALSRRIDVETATAAGHVADAAGVTWSSLAAVRSRPWDRVTRSTQLLHYRAGLWLAMGGRDYRARTLGDDPSRGYDPDEVTRHGPDVWTVRDGPDQASVILDLHRAADRFTTGNPTDWLPNPCGRCGARTVFRRHFKGTVECRSCGDSKSDGMHDAFLVAALTRTAAADPAADVQGGAGVVDLGAAA